MLCLHVRCFCVRNRTSKFGPRPERVERSTFHVECLHAETLDPGSHSANNTDLPLRVHDDCALYNPHTVCHINS